MNGFVTAFKNIRNIKWNRYLPGFKSKSQLNILYVVNVMAVGGAEMFLLRKIEALRSRGHRVSVAYWQKEGKKVDQYLQKYLNGKGIYNISNDFESIVPILKLLNAQIIHTVEGHPNYLKTAILSMPGIICVSNQTAMVWKAEYDYDHRQYTDAMVTMSHQFKEIILKKLSKPPTIIKVILNGVDCDRFNRIKRKPRILEGEEDGPINIKKKKIVLHLARINPIKNIEDSLKIAQILVDKDPNIIILLSGGCRDENSDYYDQLKQLRITYQLTHNYFFLGERSDVADLIALSDCVICTTKAHEGTPNAVLEAMAGAKPIVAFDCLGISEVVRSGETGYLVDAGDVEMAAKQIINLLCDKGLSRRLGKAARKLVLREFSLNRAVKEYEKLYYDLVQSKVGSSIDE